MAWLCDFTSARRWNRGRSPDRQDRDMVTTKRRRERGLDVSLGVLRRPVAVLARIDGEPQSAIVREAVRRLVRERHAEIAAAEREERPA